MSLSIDGVWKTGVWAETVWADGLWREGDAIPILLYLMSCTSNITTQSTASIKLADNSNITTQSTVGIKGC